MSRYVNIFIDLITIFKILYHFQRVAMKELKEAEGNVNAVKGTNLSQEELGMSLCIVNFKYYYTNQTFFTK
jgi:hypothetical protein